MLVMDPRAFRPLEPDRGVEGLREALLLAIRLEHSTMPPYLYAMYSLGRSNVAIRYTLREVAREEMLHMLLACNLLLAVGGRPRLGDPAFVPSYPAPLPGTLADGVPVPLAPFSRDLAARVFMKIEEPERPLRFPSTFTATAETPPRTIGQFYEMIRRRIVDLGPSIFADGGGGQLTLGGYAEFDQFPDQRVTDVDSAQRVIRHIVEQGEGTTSHPLDPVAAGDDDADPRVDLAHYYKFEEIVKGKRLRPNPHATPQTPPDQRYVYDGPPVPYDEPAVLKLRENPRAADYADTPAAAAANLRFNRAYTSVLRKLQAAFTGAPAALDDAIGTMADMSTAARELTEITLPDGTRAGPTFEYASA